MNKIVILMAQFSRDIALPEIAFPVIKELKAITKTFTFTPYKMKVKNTLKLIENNVRIVLEARKKIDFTPVDIQKSQQFEGRRKICCKFLSFGGFILFYFYN